VPANALRRNRPECAAAFHYIQSLKSDRGRKRSWKGPTGHCRGPLANIQKRTWEMLVNRMWIANVATSPVVLRWLCDSPRTGCAWRIKPLYMKREQAIVREIASMISIVACCHGAKLCAHAARDFWSQHLTKILNHRKIVPKTQKTIYWKPTEY